MLTKKHSNLSFSQVCPVHIGSFGHNTDEVTLLDIPDISNFLAIFRPAKVAFVLWKTQNNSRILYIQRFLLLGVGGGIYRWFFYIFRVFNFSAFYRLFMPGLKLPCQCWKRWIRYASQ